VKRIKVIILIALLLFFSALSGFFLDLLLYSSKPATNDPSTKSVIIYPGQGFRVASERLRQAGVILKPAKFRLLARIKGYDKRIKAGEYLISSSMSPLQILEIMVSGKVHLYKLTIPEGYNLHQIASRIARAGLGTETDFLKAATDPDRVKKEGIEGETFEGYLFPDTYYFPKWVTPEMIISTMVKRLWSVFTPEWRERAKTLRFSIHQVVTLASIIEKEAGVPEELPIISSVFHNRLKRRMRLESDPTVIYGIKDFNGDITRKHLSTPTPYNTYKMKGLPPGPIANPGKGALAAALFPADTNFIFFVSKKDNTHQFSTNLRSHNRAVRKYQLSR